MNTNVSNVSNVSNMSIFGKAKAMLEEVNIDLGAIIDTYAFFQEQRKDDPDFRIPTYRAKIPAGGGKAFDIITGDEELDTSVTSFKGVIATFHKSNALFENGSEEYEAGRPPICQSQDGFIGINLDGEERDCADCEHNQWGSSHKGGKGKECKNMRRLYILVEGSNVPIIMTLPPTSIKIWEEYRANLAADRKTPGDVITEFSIGQKQKNAAGKEYSIIKLKAIGSLSTETRLTVKALGNGEVYNKDISGEDYNTGAIRTHGTEDLKETA